MNIVPKKINLKAIKERLEHATPGSWWFQEEVKVSWVEKIIGVCSKYFLWSGNGTIFCMLSTDYNAKNDLKFIARSKQDVEDLVGEVERLNEVIDGLRNENIALKKLKERKAMTKIHMQLREELEESKQEVKRLKRLLIRFAGFLHRFTANAEQYSEEIHKEINKDYKLIDATQFTNNLSNKEGVNEEFERRGYSEQLKAMDELVQLSEEMGLYNNED